MFNEKKDKLPSLKDRSHDSNSLHPMKSSIPAFFVFVFLFQSAFCQSGEIEHSFKITGKKRVAVYTFGSSFERSVEYDPNSPDHLFVTEYNRDGLEIEKDQFLYKGEKFNLAKVDDYFTKKELLRDGSRINYRKDGSISSELIYKENSLQHQTFYYENGQKKASMGGNEKFLKGPLKMWYPNGQLSFSGNYNFNLKDGDFESYDESGNLTRKGVYKGNKLISGESVVMDLEYAKPDVPAQFAKGEDAFNDYLEEKTKDLEITREIKDDDYRDFQVGLHIDEKGHLVNMEPLALTDTAEQHLIQFVFQDFPDFKPATLEGCPVRSFLWLDLVLTSQGMHDGFPENLLPGNDSIDNQTFFLVEDMPHFPGGELGLRKFIANNIRYPVYAQEHGIQGKVYVKFVIDQYGIVRNISVVKSVDPELDAEAKRVISLSPRWKPGIQRGKPVRVIYTVPINFVIQ